MKRIFLYCLFLLAFKAYTQNLKLGVRLQKTHTLYHENGLSLQYNFPKIKPERFFVGFDFVSSRLGSAFKANAIKQASYIFSGSWFLFPKKQYHITTRLNMGYFYSNLESDIFDDLPNKAFLLSPEIGFTYNFKKEPISLNVGSGFYIIRAKSGYSPGTLQPLYYHFDVYYTLFKGTKNE